MSAPADTVRVHVRHVRAAGLCARGLLYWFARFERAKVRRFCREGLPAAELEAMDDAYAQTLAALARKEAAGG